MAHGEEGWASLGAVCVYFHQKKNKMKKQKILPEGPGQVKTPLQEAGLFEQDGWAAERGAS